MALYWAHKATGRIIIDQCTNPCTQFAKTKTVYIMWAANALINASLPQVFIHLANIVWLKNDWLIGREGEFAGWRIPNKMQVVEKGREEEKE